MGGDSQTTAAPTATFKQRCNSQELTAANAKSFACAADGLASSGECTRIRTRADASGERALAATARADAI